MERSAFRFKQLTCTWNGNSLTCPDYLGAVQLSEKNLLVQSMTSCHFAIPGSFRR